MTTVLPHKLRWYQLCDMQHTVDIHACMAQVVVLDAGTTALVYTEEDLTRLQTVIQDSHATSEELILALRKLSCHEISVRDLQEVMPLLHPSVQACPASPHSLRQDSHSAMTWRCKLPGALPELSLGYAGAVQMLEYHQNTDVARIAGRLVCHLTHAGTCLRELNTKCQHQSTDLQVLRLVHDAILHMQVDKWMQLQDRGVKRLQQ